MLGRATAITSKQAEAGCKLKHKYSDQEKQLFTGTTQPLFSHTQLHVILHPWPQQLQSEK